MGVLSWWVCLLRNGQVSLPVQILLGSSRARRDVELEDLRRQEDRGAGVWNIHDAADVTFDGRGAEDRVGLLAGVTELLHVLDGVEAGAAIGDVSVEIILLAVFINRDTLEDEMLQVTRLDRAGLKEIGRA